jgi:hypothetical protein
MGEFSFFQKTLRVKCLQKLVRLACLKELSGLSEFDSVG